MESLFDSDEDEHFEFKPLAERMRPTTLDNFFGQKDIVGEDSPFEK